MSTCPTLSQHRLGPGQWEGGGHQIMVILSFTNNTCQTVFYHHKIRLFGHCLEPRACARLNITEHQLERCQKYFNVFPVIWVEGKNCSNANKSCFIKPAPADWLMWIRKREKWFELDWWDWEQIIMHSSTEHNICYSEQFWKVPVIPEVVVYV